MSWRLIVITLIFVVEAKSVYGQGIISCTFFSTNCSCETNLGSITLLPLATEAPQEVYNEPSQETFYWNPCIDVTLGSVTGGIIVKSSSGVYKNIGSHSGQFTSVFNGNVYFNLPTVDSSVYIISSVKCVCGSGQTLKLDSEFSASYDLTFTSDYCCPGYKPASSAGISPGTILLIVFLGALVAYFMFGTTYMVAVKKAQGRERVPNVTFWASVPGLIKDGFMFTFTCGRQNYTKI